MVTIDDEISKRLRSMYVSITSHTLDGRVLYRGGVILDVNPLSHILIRNSMNQELCIAMANPQEGITYMKDTLGNTLYRNDTLKKYYEGKLSFTKEASLGALLIQGNYYL